MYEHRGYYDHANTLLTHGKDKDDLCMVVYLCPIKDSLLAYVVVKVQATQSGHPIGMFFSSAAKIVTVVINLNLHFVF